MSAVIDLTSSPEPDDSPDKAARSILQGFKPRKQKSGLHEAEESLDQDAHPQEVAARTALQNFLPRKQKNGIKAPIDPKKYLNGQISRGPKLAKGGGQPVNGHNQQHATVNHQKALKPEGGPGAGIGNGSLASLIQQELATGTNERRIPNKHRMPFRKGSLDHIESTSSRTNGSQSDRGSRDVVNYLNGSAHNMVAVQASSRKSLSSKVLLSSDAPKTKKLPAGIIKLDEQDIIPKDPKPAPAKPSVVSLGDDFADTRPLKRQRVEGSDGSLHRSSIGHVSRKSKQQLDEPDISTQAFTDDHSSIGTATPLPGPLRSVSLQRPQSPQSLRNDPSVTKAPEKTNNVPQNLPLDTINAPERHMIDARVRSSELVHDMSYIADDSGATKAKRRLPGRESSAQPPQRSKSATPPTSQTRNLFGVVLPSPRRGIAQLASIVERPADLPQKLANANAPESASTKVEGEPEIVKAHNNHGVPYTPEEDALLINLKEVDKLSWDDIVPHFHGRTFGSLQVRYSSKLRGRNGMKPAKSSHPPRLMNNIDATDSLRRSESSDSREPRGQPRRKRRTNEASVLTGFVSWADVKKRRLMEDTQDTNELDQKIETEANQDVQLTTERAYSKSLSRILRQRELGSNGGRSWSTSTRTVPEELKEHVFDQIGPRRYFKGTSGDVTCIAWAPDGTHFAAGSIAISDERSMQYNRPNNLLLGDCERSMLRELPEHHIPRPNIDVGSGNVNGLHSMQQTQDPRLFMTVANVQFSPDSDVLYSAGSDRVVRAYEISQGINHASCMYEIDHAAPLDLISISNAGRLATACHQSADGSIGIYDGHQRTMSLSPSRMDSLIDRAIYPSALRWGTAYRHSNLLLAGFSIDSIDDERDQAGETCLWDIATGQRIELAAVTRNVFDIAWNPSPSSTSTLFAIASSSGGNKVGRGMRSVVQCFAPGQDKAKRVLEWECPAFDINDVAYCPFDDNLIATGATDGKVYIWDQRFAGMSNRPLHALEHGNSLNVLDHDREREIADTGVRFLSWGATSSRLYSGSSDGVVKVWNPYRSTEDTHIKDIAAFTSAVMSGAFSPDGRHLLIGEDQGRLNLLSVGYQHVSTRAMRRFDFNPAPAPNPPEEDRLEVARRLVRSGQIELRPMGGLPLRQAVKGPKYRGPYLVPSDNETQAAEQDYQRALDEQGEAHTQAAVSTPQSHETESALWKVDEQVQAAQEKLLRLQSRLDDSVVLAAQAAATQLRFRKAEKNRLKLEASLPHPVEHCKLNCNYLPLSAEDDGEVPDSRRSEARIPSSLRTSHAVDSLEMTPDELVEAGLTEKCMSCFGPAKRPGWDDRVLRDMFVASSTTYRPVRFEVV